MIRLLMFEEKACLTKFMMAHEGRIQIAALTATVNIDAPEGADDPDRFYLLCDISPPTPIEDLPIVEKSDSVLYAISGHYLIRGDK